MEEAHYKQIETIKKIVNSKTIFADIGACRGDILKYLCNDCLRGYAFEPDPSNFAYLMKNFGNKNVELINSAVSDVSTKIPFYVSESYVGNILGHDMDYRPFSKHIEIECTTLDDYFCDKDIDFIKMDVEGAEWKVFKGAKTILSTKSIVFQVEFHLDEDWHDRDILYDMGYDIYTLDLQKISRDNKRIYQGIVAKDLI